MKNLFLVLLIVGVGFGVFYSSDVKIRALHELASEKDLITKQEVQDTKMEVQRINQEVVNIKNHNSSNVDIKLAEVQRELQKRNKDLEDFLLKKIIEVEDSLDALKKEIKGDVKVLPEKKEDPSFTEFKNDLKKVDKEIKEKEKNDVLADLNPKNVEKQKKEVQCYDREDVKSCVKELNQKCSNYVNVDSSLNASIDNEQRVECSSYYIDTTCASRFCFRN